eukprot:Plantae.Rhodophyta-Palmaria_palmata.ctg12897.p1 GENE.Plantae.Rhodophyta-Palmaria_palmata.ctg12897~~Plantae.Rhodophyta-Palmaria_palmata.ctg12897.p1  ORF type:complete len:150 (-),score=19.31 Plantae.Rhodophyta-Palmaria_palmata.ctg12897:501-950(-)
MAPRGRKRPVKWKTSWELQYGLAVAERKPSDSSVVSAKCLFCVYYGREDSGLKSGGRKRVRTSSNKYFSSPFRSDNMKLHVESQYKKRWDEYTSLEDEDKKMFFDRTLPVANTLRALSRERPSCASRLVATLLMFSLASCFSIEALTTQ